jgi:hypothetical protein
MAGLAPAIRVLSMFTLTGNDGHHMSLLGAKRLINLQPDEPDKRSSAPQAGNCFVASLLAMTAASTIPVMVEML